MVAKKKVKQKPKQTIKQKQSQNIIVNINQTKKKPSKRQNTTQKNNNTSVIYSMPDNRALDSLRSDLVNTNNKLLNIQKTQNLVNNNNNISDTKYYSRDDNIGDWKDVKRFKDEKKKEEEKQNRKNLHRDIIKESQIFNLRKELKNEKKEKVNQVKENLNNTLTIDSLTKQIDNDRQQFNDFIKDVENDYTKQSKKAQDHYGMRDNDINVKAGFSEMTPNEKARYHVERKRIRKIKEKLKNEAKNEPVEMYHLFETDEKAGDTSHNFL